MTIPEYYKFYHIYNRGINGCNLFHETDNYHYFSHLINKYISPMAVDSKTNKIVNALIFSLNKV